MDGSTASTDRRMAWGAARCYCLLVGAFFLVRAATTLGGGASFDRPGDGWRSVFQLTMAAILIIGLGRGQHAPLAVAVTTVVYAALTVLELFDGTEIVGTIPVDMRDRWVHPLLAIIGLACLAARRSGTLRRALG